MANTTTDRYALVKPEVGAATDSWGSLINTNLNDIDSQLLRKLDKALVDAVSQTITIANTNSRVTTATTKGFQNVGVGDRIFISGSDADGGSNNGIHTVTAIDTTNWLYVDCSGTTFVDDGAQTMTWGVVTKMKIDSSPGIDTTPIGANAASTGKFTTLEATSTSALAGNVSLGEDVTLSFEGATANDFETTLTVTDPTADRTVTLPDATDTLVGKATTDTLTNKTINSSTINSPTNTVHADQWRITRTITLTGDATSPATDIDGSGNVTINTTVGGLVKFVAGINSSSLPSLSSGPGAGKTFIAYGIEEAYDTTPNAVRHNYGYGSPTAYVSGTSTTWTQVLPPGSPGTTTIIWTHYIRMDNV
tara:strand:- start:21104 stop:22195 length:1092 start_codon:yes stop_codon:yes gene_type:complete